MKAVLKVEKILGIQPIYRIEDLSMNLEWEHQEAKEAIGHRLVCTKSNRQTVWIFYFEDIYSVLKSIHYFSIEIVFHQFCTRPFPTSMQYCFCFISRDLTVTSSFFYNSCVVFWILKSKPPYFRVKNSPKTKFYNVRMLSWLISLRSRRPIYEFPVHFRSNFRWKNFEKFLLAKKNRLQISRGLLAGHFYVRLHLIGYKL